MPPQKRGHLDPAGGGLVETRAFAVVLLESLSQAGLRSMSPHMTTPEQTPDTELEVQELTDENLEEVSGGAHPVVAALGGGLLGDTPLVGDGATPVEVRRTLF